MSNKTQFTHRKGNTKVIRSRNGKFEMVLSNSADNKGKPQVRGIHKNEAPLARTIKYTEARADIPKALMPEAKKLSLKERFVECPEFTHMQKKFIPIAFLLSSCAFLLRLALAPVVNIDTRKSFADVVMSLSLLLTGGAFFIFVKKIIKYKPELKAEDVKVEGTLHTAVYEEGQKQAFFFITKEGNRLLHKEGDREPLDVSPICLPGNLLVTEAKTRYFHGDFAFEDIEVVDLTY